MMDQFRICKLQKKETNSWLSIRPLASCWMFISDTLIESGGEKMDAPEVAVGGSHVISYIESHLAL